MTWLVLLLIRGRYNGAFTRCCTTGTRVCRPALHRARLLAKWSRCTTVSIIQYRRTHHLHHENPILSLTTSCLYLHGKQERLEKTRAPVMLQLPLAVFPWQLDPPAPQRRQGAHEYARQKETPLSYHLNQPWLQMDPLRQKAAPLCLRALVMPRPPRTFRVSRRAPRLSDGGQASVGGAWFPAFGRSSPRETLALLVLSRLGSATSVLRYRTATNSVPCDALATSPYRPFLQTPYMAGPLSGLCSQ